MNIVDLDWADTLPLRNKVLWPDKSLDFCRVKGDDEARHFGVLMGNDLVCVASVYINGQ